MIPKTPDVVRGLYITGSMAKNEMDEDSDIDIIAIVDGDIDLEDFFENIDFDRDVQVNVFKVDELRNKVKEDPTIAIMIKEGIPVKPLSDEELDELLRFTREDLVNAIISTSEDLIKVVELPEPKDSAIFLTMMFVRKLYILRSMLLGKKVSKLGFIEEFRRYYSDIEDIYQLKKRVERGETVEINEEKFEKFLNAVVEYVTDILKSLNK